MRTDVIIVDEFYADPESVRNYALKLDYYYPYESTEAVEVGRERATWMASRFRLSRDCPFKSSAQLISALEELTGEQIDIAHWNADFPVTDDGKADPLHKQKADRGACGTVHSIANQTTGSKSVTACTITSQIRGTA